VRSANLQTFRLPYLRVLLELFPVDRFRRLNSKVVGSVLSALVSVLIHLLGVMQRDPSDRFLKWFLFLLERTEPSTRSSILYL
jgi:hypothetical protein